MVQSDPSAAPFLAAVAQWADAHRDVVPFDLAPALGALSQRFPGYSDGAYAEFRLNGDARLDYLAAFDRRNASSCLPNDAHGVAPAVVRFLGRWRSGAPFSSFTRTVWLEFDDVLRRSAAATPSLSALLAQSYGAEHRPAESPARQEDADRLLLLLDEMTNGSATAVERERLKWCALSLPEQSQILYLSVMHGRDPRAVKLYLVLPRDSLFGYLDRLGWCGSWDQLKDFLKRVATSDTCGPLLYCDLNLENLHDQVACTLGIAFSQQQAVMAAPDDCTRTRLMARLVDVQLCERRMASALGAWPALDAQWAPPSFLRWLDVKCVLHASGSIESKAYLGMRERRNPFVDGLSFQGAR